VLRSLLLALDGIADAEAAVETAAYLAASKGVAIDVRSGALSIPEPLAAVGAALGADPFTFVLTGGDDHALAATFAPDVPLPEHWRVIGSVAEGSGVTVDAQTYAGAPGHEHFR